MFAIDLSPPELENVLEKEIENAIEDAAKLVADDAPDEMRGLMFEGGVSKKGEPPRRQSGDLAKSLDAKIQGVNSVEISMIDYGFYLDELFKEEGDSGGYLERNFIEKGVDLVLEKL